MATVDYWTDQARLALQSYDEGLLRKVVGRLLKPRNQWPAEELIKRTLATLVNPPDINRRLKDLSPPCRQVLALMAHSRQPRWRLGSLIEMLYILGAGDGLEPIKTLVEMGLLFPALPGMFDGQAPGKSRIKDLDLLLTVSAVSHVFTLPQVSARALGEPLAGGRFPWWEALNQAKPAVREADGLDWLLRLATLWQLALGGSFRRTVQGDFFKRDLDRLRQDPLLSTGPHDALTEIPDPSMLTVCLGLVLGIVKENDEAAGEMIAGVFPDEMQKGFQEMAATLWSQLPLLRGWNGAAGWQPELAFRSGESASNPYPALHLLSLLLLGDLGENEWANPEALEEWLLTRHPYWRAGVAAAGEGKEIGKQGDKETGKQEGAVSVTPGSSSLPRGIVTGFLLGLAYPLKLLQAVPGAGGKGWLVRLSALGRYVLGLAEAPAAAPSFPQTLLVQPNLEILAYRQGLTPELIVRLSRFATWKGLGAACTLQVEPGSVYRALEMGETFASLVQSLERHSMKAVPLPVIESLRTWADKRDRITIFPSGVLLEFPTAADMAEAFSRGLPGYRLSDRLAIVPGEKDIDYRHFRLTGSRDYFLPPEKCVDVDEDGVTLSVDLARSDLLLETELVRFAELVNKLPQQASTSTQGQGRKLYRLTPASAAAGRNNGMEVQQLESWFRQRTGDELPAAARLLFTGPEVPAAELRRQLVLHVSAAAVADGLLQWPATRGFIESRLGPTALVVAEENVAALQAALQEVGVRIQIPV